MHPHPSSDGSVFSLAPRPLSPRDASAHALEVQGPAWDIAVEYPDLASPVFAADIAVVEALIEKIQLEAQKLVPLVGRAADLSGIEGDRAVAAAQEATKLFDRAVVLARNVATYVEAILSVDGTDEQAKGQRGQLDPLMARMSQAYNPVTQFLRHTSDQTCALYLADPAIEPHRFSLEHSRKLRELSLSLAEEDLLIGLNVHGPKAWGNLYDNLSATIRCRLELPEGEKTAGLAEASSLLQSPREEVRRAAYDGIRQGWAAHGESVAGVLNALSGWRLEVYRRRSSKRPVHFLDFPLHAAHMQRATLDALFQAVGEVKELGRRSLKLMARLLGKERADPWDLFAPCPSIAGDEAAAWNAMPFKEAIAMIAESFATIHPEMGEFVRMMAERRWIEGRVSSNKRPGAYCTEFVKSRTPRVYMSYDGGMREVQTLAHELGHAFHDWMMRDMPLVQRSFPMTLAETASILAETLVGDALLAKAQTPGARLPLCWLQARNVEAFLLNIPARFDFESTLYEKRAKTVLSPKDLSAMMRDAWASWYGDALSEMDDLFWASKLHFSISSLSFYNFPYTFGYLFSLGVLAQRERLGAGFFDAYRSLLRDTGSMSVEDVAQKHLGADLTKPDFWRQSLGYARKQVEQLEATAQALGKA